MKEQCNAGTICLLMAKYEDFVSVYRVVMNLKQKMCPRVYMETFILLMGVKIELLYCKKRQVFTY